MFIDCNARSILFIAVGIEKNMEGAQTAIFK